MHSCYLRKAPAADRRQALVRNAHGHDLAPGRRPPGAAKLPSQWAAVRLSGRLCGATTVVASATDRRHRLGQVERWPTR